MKIKKRDVLIFIRHTCFFYCLKSSIIGMDHKNSFIGDGITSGEVFQINTGISLIAQLNKLLSKSYPISDP
jgi:hypothetical protein